VGEAILLLISLPIVLHAIPVIKTEKNEVLGSRAYTPEQVKVIAEQLAFENELLQL
jgi:hypothetical protein